MYVFDDSRAEPHHMRTTFSPPRGAETFFYIVLYMHYIPVHAKLLCELQYASF